MNPIPTLPFNGSAGTGAPLVTMRAIR